MNLSAADQRAVLDVFALALRRESNVLGRRPETAWQQLANRLQWAEGPVESLLEAERARRTAAGATPWLWLRTSVREATALRQVLEHTDWVAECAFSPDGTHVASVGPDRALRLWDGRTGAAGLILQGHTGWVWGCAFSPDGTLLASVGEDGTVRLWDVRTGAPGPILQAHTGSATACAFSPDGALLASASWTVHLWDARTGAPVEGGELVQVGGVTGCAFSPDGTLLASAGHHGTLLLWDARTAAPGPNLQGHTDTVTGCAFSPDGTLLASASKDRTLRLWDARTGMPGPVLEFPDALECVAFAPNQPLLVCGGESGLVHRVELAGVTFGPLVVTAADRDGAPKLRCPACGTAYPVEASWLGHVLSCPACGRGLLVNPFVVEPPAAPISEPPAATHAARGGRRRWPFRRHQP